MEYYSVKEKDAIMSFSNMDEPRDYHAKWSMLVRERQVSYDITYVQDLKNDANEFTY